MCKLLNKLHYATASFGCIADSFHNMTILLAMLCNFFSIFVLPDRLHDTYVLTLWPFKSLVSAVARALFSLNAHCMIMLSLSDVQGTHNGTAFFHFSDKS